jgi:hypothetical protein
MHHIKLLFLTFLLLENNKKTPHFASVARGLRFVACRKPVTLEGNSGQVVAMYLDLKRQHFRS